MPFDNIIKFITNESTKFFPGESIISIRATKTEITINDTEGWLATIYPDRFEVRT